MERRFKVAAVHAAPVLLDVEACIEKACALIREAANQSARLVVFPEVFVPGFPYWINCYPPLVQAPLNCRYQDASIEIRGSEIARIQEVARASGIVVVLGISERAVGGRTCYNTQLFIEDDG